MINSSNNFTVRNNLAQKSLAVTDAPASAPQAPVSAPAPETSADSVGKTEVFNWQPQDAQVMATTTRSINGVYQDADSKPSTAKVKLNFPLEREGGKFVYPNGDERQVQSIAFANAAVTAETLTKVFDVQKWAFPGEQLKVNANSGQMLNAFYKRDMGAVNGFRSPDRVLGRTIYSFASGDVLPHEVGHAILDAIRPSYLGTFSGDVAAFHESFGDMCAMHMALMDDRVIKRVVVQTGGDLTKSNMVSEIAEEMGMAVNHEAGSQVTGGDFLRNAANNFKWADPATLPDKGGATELGREAHSFSRLWTGAHYDILTGLVKEKMAAGADAFTAIKTSNVELLGMLGNMMKDAPQGSFSYRDMALNFIATDQKYAGGKHAALITKVMTDRQILPADAPTPMAGLTRSMMAPMEAMGDGPPTTDVNFSLDNSFGELAGAQVVVPVDSRTALFQSQDAVDDTTSSIRLLAQDGRIKITQKGEAFDPNKDYLSPAGEVYVGALVWEGDQKKLVRLAVVD